MPLPACPKARHRPQARRVVAQSRQTHRGCSARCPPPACTCGRGRMSLPQSRGPWGRRWSTPRRTRRRRARSTPRATATAARCAAGGWTESAEGFLVALETTGRPSLINPQNTRMHPPSGRVRRTPRASRGTFALGSTYLGQSRAPPTASGWRCSPVQMRRRACNRPPQKGTRHSPGGREREGRRGQRSWPAGRGGAGCFLGRHPPCNDAVWIGCVWAAYIQRLVFGMCGSRTGRCSCALHGHPASHVRTPQWIRYHPAPMLHLQALPVVADAGPQVEALHSPALGGARAAALGECDAGRAADFPGLPHAVVWGRARRGGMVVGCRWWDIIGRGLHFWLTAAQLLRVVCVSACRQQRVRRRSQAVCAARCCREAGIGPRRTPLTPLADVWVALRLTRAVRVVVLSGERGRGHTRVLGEE
jgi:hypothetical protein